MDKFHSAHIHTFKFREKSNLVRPLEFSLTILSTAFRDRQAGSANNQGKPTDDSVRQDRHPRREGGGRGRGGARGGAKFDRHSRGVGG